ncbi:hypothetical protein [Paeniglutamicibacter psychrophenolicus]|uniref:hypothetical protein n=1 Tax=Paeniglutamicibacter psychrophenolicus TaxID=257454 RepID=UPI002788A414|nr:hypothetical protein [Paeniglutamicibacter psychrophenolicus]MDQ0095788.1 hypothetical protein [Paeniglutamicibacter psychrophenolicus]
MRLKVLATGTIALALLVTASYLPGQLEGATNWPLAAVTLVLIAAFALGWPRLMKLSAPLPVSVVIFLVGAGSTVLGLWAPPRPSLGWVAPALAAGVILVFLTQLVRGTDATKRLESAAVGMLGLLVAAFGSGWAVLGTEPAWRSVALMAGISILAAAVPGVLRLPDRIVFPLGFVLAVLAGGAASMLHPAVQLAPALVLGAACGLVVVGSRAMLVSLGGPTGTVQMAAAALAPLLVCGSVTWYVLLLLL